MRSTISTSNGSTAAAQQAVAPVGGELGDVPALAQALGEVLARRRDRLR